MWATYCVRLSSTYEDVVTLFQTSLGNDLFSIAAKKSYLSSASATYWLYQPLKQQAGSASGLRVQHHVVGERQSLLITLESERGLIVVAFLRHRENYEQSGNHTNAVIPSYATLWSFHISDMTFSVPKPRRASDHKFDKLLLSKTPINLIYGMMLVTAHCVHLLVTQSEVNQPTNQPINQPFNQSISQSYIFTSCNLVTLRDCDGPLFSCPEFLVSPNMLQL